MVRYSTFIDADLTQARLSDVLATDAVMIRANFTNVIAGGNGFVGVDASGATFVCAQFGSSKFDQAVFIYANFTDADLNGTTAVSTDFTGAPDMAAAPIRPRTGMWRAAEGGTGYLFETAGAGLHLLVIGFDGLGLPTWSVAEGRIGRDNVFTAGLKHCASVGTRPADCGIDLGPITVSSDSATSASVLAPSAAAVRISPATRN